MENKGWSKWINHHCFNGVPVFMHERRPFGFGDEQKTLNHPGYRIRTYRSHDIQQVEKAMYEPWKALLAVVIKHRL